MRTGKGGGVVTWQHSSSTAAVLSEGRGGHGEGGGGRGGGGTRRLGRQGMEQKVMELFNIG